MKIKFLPIASCMLFTSYAVDCHAQAANRTLSNLNSPTAVNQSLIPGTNNIINLGSGGRSGLNWNNIYLGNALYLKGKITLHAPGAGNFFVGVNAGGALVTGSYNTGIGQFCLFKTSGDDNTANGYQALYNNTDGYYNTANGFEALASNNTGDWNTALGTQTLYNNTEGFGNTAIGGNALWRNNGGDNTAIGSGALYNNTTGNSNTALGDESLFSNSTGSFNTTLGFQADVSAGNLFNATAIGRGAIVDASDKVRIGDGSVKSIGGQVSWTTFSDGRYKKDIKENVQGLAFINSLRPITYTVNVQGLNEYYNKGRKQLLNDEALNNEIEMANAEIKKGEDEASKIVYNGFVAQEVEQAAKKLNYEFSGIDKPQTKDGLYGLRYDNFVVPLVKAVQELSKMNDEKDAKINALQNQNDDLKKRIDRLEAMMNIGQSSMKLSDASLAQNVPNPFTGTTTISYSLPATFTTAQIIITDKSGRQLKQLNISGTGNGAVNIDASVLTAGAYNYSLIVDGRIISSKQMIVGK
jgi:hypothetical protein